MKRRKRPPKPRYLDPKWVDSVLMPAIQKAINERDVLIIAPDSRQAADLNAGTHVHNTVNGRT
jgi:uncharacterized membrane-anchored protein